MSYSHSETEKEKYLAAFRMFDKDGLGRVSASDLGSMMKSLGKYPTAEELQGKDNITFVKRYILAI